IAPALHDVAGIDEPVVAREHRAIAVYVAVRVACRAKQERSIVDRDLDVAGRADERRRESFETVLDFESDAGFRRRKRVADAGIRIERAHRVQNPLVRDLARQADVARRDGAAVRAHERAAPMRWGARQMRHALRAEAYEKVADRF